MSGTKIRGVSDVTRRRVLRRDGHRCVYCQTDVDPLLAHIDHVLPVAYGGQSVVDNLVVACKACNMDKWARTDSHQMFVLAASDHPLAYLAHRILVREGAITDG